MQADGTITPLNSTQNFVLSEKQAGEILAQVRSVKTKNFNGELDIGSVFNLSKCARHRKGN